MGQTKNTAGCQKAFFFQEFVPRFQLACITLWLFPSPSPLFQVFQAAHVGISALPRAGSWHKLQLSPPHPRVPARILHRSTTAGQPGGGNAAHTSLPRQLFVLPSEHKPQNTWKQVTWLVCMPQTQAQPGEIPHGGFPLSHGVCKHSAHKYYMFCKSFCGKLSTSAVGK